ncbi:hypothetical protein [Methylovulum psychrotolerans]|nr:hypothetical protein [Methylovulum psychrotolerans]
MDVNSIKTAIAPTHHLKTGGFILTEWATVRQNRLPTLLPILRRIIL